MAHPSGPPSPRRRLVAALVLPLVLVGGPLAVGCGDDGDASPSAATRPGDGRTDVPEPAVAPAPAAAPAGLVVPLPGRPEGLVFTGDGLVAGVDGGLARLGLDGAPLGLVALSGRPRHLAAGGAPGSVLAPLEGSDELVTLAADGTVASTARVGDQPHDAVAADDRVFVGDELADTVSVTRGAEVLATVAAPVQPGGLARVGGTVAVVGVRGRRIGFIDSATLATVATLPCGVGPTHVVADADRFYVADTQGDALLVYRGGAEPAELARVSAAGAPYGLAVDPVRRQLWVTLTGRNELAAFDLTGDQPRPLGSYPTVRQPNSVAVDPATGIVYVAGAADGELQILDPGAEPPSSAGR